jgi:hypothetical protein
MKIILSLLAVVFVVCAEETAPVERPANYELVGKGLAADIEKYVNVMVDYTRTKCLASPGKTPSAYSFIVIAEKPLMAIPAAKKAWILGVAGSVGKVCNDNPTYQIDEVWLADMETMKARKTLIIDAGLIKNLSKQIRNDEIDLDKFYLEVSKAITEKVLPEKVSPAWGSDQHITK